MPNVAGRPEPNEKTIGAAIELLAGNPISAYKRKPLRLSASLPERAMSG
jgi:hypothetical protein